MADRQSGDVRRAHELDDVAKRGVQQAADDVAEAQREVLRHLAQHQRQRQQRKEILRQPQMGNIFGLEECARAPSTVKPACSL